MTTAPELLPCPFCGWEAEVVSGGPGNHFIQCKGCRATSDDRHLDSAIAAWNRREAATALSEALEEVKREKQWRQQLQHALSYWMPGVNEETDSGHRKAGDDACLLAAMEGDVDDRSWGNNIIAQRDEAKAENERLTRERDKWFREAEERADACSLLIRERDGLREALTPSGDTKTAYMGEFSFNIEDYDEDGMEWARVVTVPWTTVKDIMAAIRARAALNPKGGDNG